MVVSVSVVEVAALANIPVASTWSTSKPSVLSCPGLRPPTGVPESLTVLLKKLFAGFCASDSGRPPTSRLSPVVPRSPSYATAPIFACTVPVCGVSKPVTGMSVLPPETWPKPSYTRSARMSWAALWYATTSDHPAYEPAAIDAWMFATPYTPLPMPATWAVTSANPW